MNAHDVQESLNETVLRSRKFIEQFRESSERFQVDLVIMKKRHAAACAELDRTCELVRELHRGTFREGLDQG